MKAMVNMIDRLSSANDYHWVSTIFFGDI